MAHTMNPLTRRSFLHGGFRLSLVLAGLLGVTRVPDVAADKKKPKKASVAERTENQRDLCEIGGGKLAVLDGPNGGNTTECKGGGSDGYTCINTKKATKCSMQLTNPPTKPIDGGTVPPSDVNEDPTDGGSPVGGGAVPPSGVNEQPTDPGSVGGGDHVGGGVVGPGGANEQPGDSGGGGVILYADYGSKHDRAKQRRKRKRRGNKRGR